MTSAIWSVNSKSLENPFSIHRTGSDMTSSSQWSNPLTYMQLCKDAMVLACDPTRKELFVPCNLVQFLYLLSCKCGSQYFEGSSFVQWRFKYQVPGKWSSHRRRYPNWLLLAVSLAHPALNQQLQWLGCNAICHFLNMTFVNEGGGILMEPSVLPGWEVNKSLMGWIYQYLQGQVNLFFQSKERKNI